MYLNGILFIHIPRTSGTTFEKDLGFKGHYDKPACGHREWGADENLIMGWSKKRKLMLQHITLQEIKDLNLVDDYDKALKVTIVRNPYTRAVSLFKYFQNRWKSFIEFLHFLQNCENIPYFFKSQYEYLKVGADIPKDVNIHESTFYQIL